MSSSRFASVSCWRCASERSSRKTAGPVRSLGGACSVAPSAAALQPAAHTHSPRVAPRHATAVTLASVPPWPARRVSRTHAQQARPAVLTREGRSPGRKRASADARRGLLGGATVLQRRSLEADLVAPPFSIHAPPLVGGAAGGKRRKGTGGEELPLVHV